MWAKQRREAEELSKKTVSRRLRILYKLSAVCRATEEGLFMDGCWFESRQVNVFIVTPQPLNETLCPQLMLLTATGAGEQTFKYTV